MAAQWYYSHGGKTYGPVTSQELRDLAAQGAILPDDTVWKEGVAEGVPAKTVKGLFPEAAAGSGSPRVTGAAVNAGYVRTGGTKATAVSSISGGADDFDYVEDNEDAAYRRKKTKKSRGKQLVLDYLFFRRMISPILIQIFFWLGTALCLLVGLYAFIDGLIPQERERALQIRNAFNEDRNLRGFDDDDRVKIKMQPVRVEKTLNLLQSLSGLLLMIFGPFFVRIFCENLILLFQINETLTDIRNQRL